MTNTKFRKRALLSSVAMLLVALVALGSATFAWFVANPTANADGLVMTTSAEAGVAIASNSVIGLRSDSESYVDAYKSSTYLNATGSSIATAAAATTVAKNLEPASPNTTLNNGSLDFGFVAAAKASEEAAATSGVWASANGKVYSEKVYLKTTTTTTGDTAEVKSAKVDITLNDATSITAKNGIKVALVSSEGELIGIWKPNAGDATKTYKGSGTGTAALTDSAYSYTNSGTYKNLATAITVNPEIDGNGHTSDWIEVYVYLDGENTGVFSNNVPTVTQLLNAISVTVSTVTQS